MNHPSSGWSFGRLLSCSIHSLIYGEQCRMETPANSHAFRKRTPSISTRSSSPRSNVTRAPPRSTSDFNSSRCSDRSCPLRQIRLPRLSATCLIFSVMVSALKNSRTNAINQPFKISTICDSVNLDFLMTSPVPGESTIYLYPSRESLRPRYGNTTTQRPIFPSGGHGETADDSVTRNSPRSSQVVRKTRQEGLLFAPTPRV